MEQVFILVNRILQQNREANKRELSLRTYRVIPLQPLAGVLEWVQDAIPIGDYLHRAHERFNVGDITPKEARLIMKREFERAGSNPASKYKVYLEEISAHFRPVMRFFFQGATTTCQEWFAMRRRYIRSTAVSSIIGFVVGLGDRHLQNIMIDQQSGELIHIDLNMIFELGKALRIPERVPFRLTRDIIDGMGYAGLEAGFTGSAIHTIRVLRSRMEMMLMIMEAFKYDPLYRWATRPPPQLDSSVNNLPQIHTALGDEDEDEGHKEAERALLRVKEKLLGLEEGTMLSEHGQVCYLIQIATSEELLAQMYPGWQPWM
jgi:ataxia telangiectasia mutated family protein